MLHLYFSNRFEILTRLMLERVGADAAGVFSATQVIVPSRAVERALTLAIADRTGICANVRFEYLARWLWQQISRFVPGVGETSPFETEILTWRVYRALCDPDFVAQQGRLEAYERGADDLMRYELACRLAALLREYSTYREDWLEAWAEGRRIEPEAQAHPDVLWQAALYRRIVAELQVDTRHPGATFSEALGRLGSAAAIEQGLPASVHIFALPTMPPQHLRLLQHLAQVIDVHMYVINPCRDYWVEVVAPRRLQALKAQGRAQYHEVGNRLLASWGRQAKAHIALLIDQTDGDDAALFEHNDADTLLARLQNSILDMVELDRDAALPAQGDRSLEVHDCHSLTRELEVLQDYLLDLFVTESSLRPADILVVTPDLEAAAPIIEAVFGTVPRDRHIPFQLTGRARSSVNSPARTLLALLSLAASRFEATAVFDLLQQPLVARCFGLEDEDLQRVRDWFGTAGIRWALDARHCAEFDLPAQGRHTFSDGLERLFLGYALPDDRGEAAFGLLPAGNASGSNALVLGAFWRFIDALRQFQSAVASAQPVAAWTRCFTQALTTFMAATPEEMEDLNELQLGINELGEAMRRGGVEGAVPLAVMHAALAAQLDEAIHGGAPTGRVTFTSLASLRNLPFEVVCVIGLNNGAFPSAAREPEFDLMVAKPRHGDRQRSLDERNLFLDLVLAARRRLYLSYCGHSARDNSSMPPSVLVSELLDVVGLVPIQHPLQAFAPESFFGSSARPLRSYNREMAEAVQASLRAMPVAAESPVVIDDEEDGGDEEDVLEPQPLFFTGSLAPPVQEPRILTLDQLKSFFHNPSRYLLARRMEIAFKYDPDELLNNEPFAVDPRGQRQLAARLLPRLIENPQDPATDALLAAGTELPAGNIGAFEQRREVASLREFALRVHPYTRAPTLPAHQASLQFDIAGESWRLDALLAELRPTGLLRWHYSQERKLQVPRADVALGAWLDHLVLCAAAPVGVIPHTVVIARNGTWKLRPPPDPVLLLKGLVEIFRQGLVAPAHFFPKAAWAYVQAKQSLREARKVWQKSAHHKFAESADAAIALAFRGQPEPLDDEFERLASVVFAPLVEYLGERLP